MLLLSAVSVQQPTMVASQTIESTPIVEASSNMVLTAEASPIATVTAKVSTSKAANSSVESAVRAYFAETPILVDVARCESRFRQYSKEGGALRGVQVREDIGVMQINEYYHGTEAKKLGLDIHTLEGNLAYAKALYDKQGVAPWSASSPCWDR